LNIYFNVENLEGLRIQNFFVGERRLDRKRICRACFLTTQRVSSKYGSKRENLDMCAVEVLVEYLKRDSPLSLRQSTP
jgi:hypothetical protein